MHSLTRYLFAGALVLATPVAAAAADVAVFAAASLREAVEEAAAHFEADTGIDVITSYAGSSVLARQIEQGAPADLFISANQQWMDRLVEQGAVIADTRVDLLVNTLVLVTEGSPLGRHDMPEMTADSIARTIGDERIAMALVDAVPAGIYGKEALQSLGLWDKLQLQVAQSDNVRTALALVERGEAKFGIVYGTDALVGRVATVGRFAEETHSPIVYPMAIVEGRDGPRVRSFYDYLVSDAAWTHFEAAGFERP